MAARRWLEKWIGGRTFELRDGSTGWILERMVNGSRFTRTLDVTSEADALAELALFKRDPAGYATKSQQLQQDSEGALCINPQNVARVKDHLTSKERDPHYIDTVVRYLATWCEDLDGADLRKTKIDELKRCLAKHKTGRPKRIAALKTFTAYFRTEVNTLPIGEDPTLALMSIQSKPEKLQREKGYPLEVVEAVYANVFDWETERTVPDRFGRHRPRSACVAVRREGWADLQGVRDVLVMRIKCGMHQSEIDRLSSGKGVIKAVKDHGEIAGTIRFTHKSKSDHTVSVDAQGLAAAKRLQSHGGPICASFLRTTLAHAARKAGLKAFSPGELRHSFITIAKEAGREVKPKLGGVPLEAIAAVVGHHGTRTTGNVYLGAHVPVMIALPIKLFHPDDPPLVTVSKSA